MTTVMERKLGDLLVRDAVITDADLQQALKRQTDGGGSLGRILMDMGVVNEWEIAATLGKQLNVPFITLSQYDIDRDVLISIPRQVVEKYRIVPVDRTGDTLTVALPDPSNIYILDELRLLTKCQIVPVISFESDIEDAIARYYKEEEKESGNLEMMLSEIAESDLEIIQANAEDDKDLNVQVNDAPVIKIVNAIIQEAIQQRASDIHVEPYEKQLRLRYRIDGVLQERPSPPKSIQNAIIARIKILSDMDIAEKRLPQDGRFKIRVGNRNIDFRVNSLPTIHGEKVVIRLLDQGSLMLDLTKLGFEQLELDRFNEQIHKPWGMVLVTGPTGSGKSTTLYSALSTINDPTLNISTIEDPVEYNLKGVNQVGVREDIGLTFAEALRAFLRQDPDIIMVGEIRDTETAQVAIKAALTGHLVLSTLHTNDAASSITRITDMGVEPFLVTASLNMIVAQRLIRKICKSCIDHYVPIEELRRAIGIMDPDARFFHGLGCEHCNNTGFRGRVALYEILVLSDHIREMVVSGATALVIKRQAIVEGMQTLRTSGVNKVKDGLCTVEEVLGATMADKMEFNE
jgi:type IV pilus assembly protein PilB